MGRVRHRSWVAAVLLLAAPIAACGGGDDGDAFTFEDDELCDWLTADEIAEYFASVYDWDGTAELVEMDDADPDTCFWRLETIGGDGVIEIGAGNADPGFLLADYEIVEYDGGPVRAPGGTVSGHPALSEGAVVQSAGWGAYSFWVPPRDEYLSLFANRAGSGGPGPRIAVEDQDRLFAFADQLLQELGWVS